MNLNGLDYAMFGPYPDQCVTAPSTCTTGFTLAMWLWKPSTCSSYYGLVTTQRASPPSEGIRISCADSSTSDIEYKMFVQPDKMCTLVRTIEPDVWVYLTMVWSVGTPFKTYQDGDWVEDGNWQTGGPYMTNLNTERKLAFGIMFTDQGPDYNYGTGYVDAVIMFNRPLTTEEVQALYNTYT